MRHEASFDAEITNRRSRRASGQRDVHSPDLPPITVGVTPSSSSLSLSLISVFGYFSIASHSKYGHWERVENLIKTLTVGTMKMFGLILEGDGWRITKLSTSMSGKDIYRLATIVAVLAV